MGDRTDNDYDAFAAAYSAMNETNDWNAGYERPAVLAMLGDITGLRTLDAGARGRRARRRVGVARCHRHRCRHERRTARARRRPAGVHRGTAAGRHRVLHYLQGWTVPLREFSQTPVPGGRLVISTHHPFMDHALAGGDDYFATCAFDDEWQVGDRSVRMRFWHRQLAAMSGALTRGGFALTVIDEPAPQLWVEDLDPRAWQSLTTARFLFFGAEAP
ncbi:SAM-dependent methyltransferase [Pseudonocardia sp. GCM10023141]|uniref:SAM-dependent methyltransferase n=1 Tax=Pseudonocardia sp. GCM10023141 TaxID=3252653 RepID=UPI003617AF6F